jgi:site-specific DNA-methyltransferase (adenine-specific)
MVDVYHGDCIKFIKSLDPNSIDMILTDPPYFLDTMDDKWSHETQISRTSNSHISKLPMGMKFSSTQGPKFEKFMNELSLELIRVLKPGGFFISFSSGRMYHNMVSGIEKAGFEIRDQVIWKYNQSQVKAFRQDHIIDNDKVMTYEQKEALKVKMKDHRTPQLKSSFEPICVAMKPIEKRFIDNFQKWGTGLIKTINNKVPENIMEINKPSKSEKRIDETSVNFHPTIKPIELMERLIGIYCPDTGVILDPFLGSGTTAVAAKRTGRKCKGSEINEDYIELIKKRLI